MVNTECKMMESINSQGLTVVGVPLPAFDMVLIYFGHLQSAYYLLICVYIILSAFGMKCRVRPDASQKMQIFLPDRRHLCSVRCAMKWCNYVQFNGQTV